MFLEDFRGVSDGFQVDSGSLHAVSGGFRRFSDEKLFLDCFQAGFRRF